MKRRLTLKSRQGRDKDRIYIVPDGTKERGKRLSFYQYSVPNGTVTDWINRLYELYENNSKSR